ncbi:MAG: MFS transporter [Promethearchaeota archaeon]
MPKKLLKLSRSEFFSLILIIVLQFIAIACANMLIPSYSKMVEYYGVDISLEGIPDAIFVFVSAGFAVVWGYYTDKIDRTRVVMVGAFLGSIGTTLTAFNAIQSFNGFLILILARAITGAGLGSIIPVVYSVLGDVIPVEERSSYFGTMAIISSISNGIGQGLSSFMGPLNIFGMSWRFPFFIMSMFSIVLIFMLFFIKLPGLGSHEKELETLKNFNLEYMYMLETKDIGQILKKKTNLVIFIAGFLCIIPGTLVIYFLTSLFSSANYGLFYVLPEGIRLQISSIMAALVGIGYIVGNMALASLGDVLYKKNKKNRVLLGGISLIIAVPVSIAFVLSAVPLESNILLLLSEDPGIFDTLLIIFQNSPSYIYYFIFAFIGSFFSAATVANRGAILVDVNLPEHRGTTTSFFNLSEQLGKGFTLLLSWPLLTAITVFFPVWNPLKAMIILAIIFWLPAGILWLYASKHVKNDMDEKSIILMERSQLSFIDYIFELEIKLDGGIQLIHDAKRNLGNNNPTAMVQFNGAIKLFQFIESRATHKDLSELSDIHNHAHNLSLKAIMLKTELKGIQKTYESELLSPDNMEIMQLKYKIDEWWPQSDLGKIEVLYDSGYLKVVEARLLRNYDLFKTLRGLNESIEIFERVIVLTKERFIEERNKKLTDEEREFQERTQELMDKATATTTKTINLKTMIEEIIVHLDEMGISSEELEKAIALAAEFELPYLEILIETVGRKKSGKILNKISKEIDELFDTYDEQLV